MSSFLLTRVGPRDTQIGEEATPGGTIGLGGDWTIWKPITEEWNKDRNNKRQEEVMQ